MGFDKNTVIGFVLLMVLLFAYMFIAQRGQLKAAAEKQKIADSLKQVNAGKTDSSNQIKDTNNVLTNTQISNLGGFVTTGAEEIKTIENEVIKVSFTNKGGQPKSIELKNFKRYDKQSLLLSDGKKNQISFTVNTGVNQTAKTSDLIFTSGNVMNENGNQVLRYTASDSSGKQIMFEYIVKPNDYMIDINIKLKGTKELLSQNTMNLSWKAIALQQERNPTYEKQQSQIGYYDNENGYDYFGATQGNIKKFEKPFKWLSVKQQFFNTTLIAKNNFNSAEIDWKVPDDSSGIINESDVILKIQVPGDNEATISLQYFNGPNDYKMLKKYDLGMHNIVNFGQNFYSFVKWINRWLILPVFDFIHELIPGSMGLTIMLLTIFIRLLISPLTYKSYLSGAKMKALRPEIDELKKKYGTDQQTFGMEQMKLFRQAGVNPLGGCIPVLFQIPIFFALFSMFNSNVDLRGHSFLWATDLSSYDSILNFGFNIPFYGSHVSLFTITACATSFFISLYSMSSTPDQGNPVLKYMPYIFPFLMLFFFNQMPAALTWYYTVSNAITLLLQWIIQRFIIDHEKIVLQIQENKKKPKEKSKLQMRIEAMQEQQKRIQDMKKKTSGK